MPSKEYRIWINETTYVVVDMKMVNGRVIAFVVRLMWIEGGRELNVMRYDTAHGMSHRDTLGRRKGLLRKDWFPDLALDIVLQKAIQDFKMNHEKYLDQYKEN